MKPWMAGVALVCTAILIGELRSEDPDWLNAGMAVLAALALVGAALQIQESKRSAATAVYAEYLKLAFEHPHFAIPSSSVNEPGLSQPYDTKYSFFVSYLLLAAEEILETQQGDAGWEATLKEQLLYHRSLIEAHDELFSTRAGRRTPMYSQRLIDIYEAAKRDVA
jgi:hypothetical protein